MNVGFGRFSKFGSSYHLTYPVVVSRYLYSMIKSVPNQITRINPDGTRIAIVASVAVVPVKMRFPFRNATFSKPFSIHVARQPRAIAVIWCRSSALKFDGNRRLHSTVLISSVLGNMKKIAFRFRIVVSR